MSKSDTDRPKILSKNLFPVVGIGASAGGLEAFKKLIKAIPGDSGMAYILVQHLHPEHESSLPDILQRVTNIPVIEIRDNVHVNANNIYVIPSNKMLVATDGILNLSERPVKGKLNLPVDVFFSSLAEVHQSHAIGVVLSGNGADGTAGLKDIKDHGGLTFAQDPASTAFYSMPQNAIDSKNVDFILPPEKIPGRLMELQQAHVVSSDDECSKKIIIEENEFQQIFALVKKQLGVDFTFYKQTTIRRRIIRRMAILNLKTVKDYLDYLNENKAESDTLFKDLLIPVTSFFREPATFDVLCKTVFPEMLKDKSINNPLRIWIAGCSTGQEAYSMAMCLLEFLGDKSSQHKVQIFATDISDHSIDKARRGAYSKKEMEGISDTQVQEFFTKAGRDYHIKKQVRDMCVFAVHNFLKDPPFAKIDLISCRNVLIYLEPFLQKKALTIFHYALNDKAVLLLGKSETAGSSPDLFTPFGKKEKLYRRVSVPGKFINITTERKETTLADRGNFLRNKEKKVNDFQKCADDILLSKYTPAGVVINEQFDIVQFRGLTGEYLSPSPGLASLNVLKMAREGLSFEIRNALHKAKSTREPCIKGGIPVDKGKKLVNIEVIPLLDTIDVHYLILFRDEIASPIPGGNEQFKTGNGHAVDLKDHAPYLFRIEQMEKELAHAREDMHTITEDQEAANEELQSSNEELLSGSEELQSLNEELETGREELQSTNEELVTVNQELHERNTQLNLSRKFAEAIISILHEPMLVLDNNFIIKNANKSFYKSFLLTEDATRGKILFQLQNNGWDIPGLRKELEKIRNEKETMIDVEIAFNFPLIGERIVHFNIQPINKENGEQLILLALDDITSRRNEEKLLSKKVSEQIVARKQLERNAEMIQNLYMNAPAFICTLLGPKYIYTLVNPSYQKIFGKRNLVGKPIMEALPELEGQGFDKILDNVYNTGETFVGTEVSIALSRDEGLLPERCYFNFSYQPLYNEDKKINGILVFGYEVTEIVRGRKIQEESNARFRILADAMPQKMSTSDAYGNITYLNQQWVDYTHKSFTELKEPGWKSILHPDDYDINQQTWQHSISTGENYELEQRFLRHDETYRWHLSRRVAQKDENGKIISWIGTHTDINDQKLFEEELKKQLTEGIKLEKQKNDFISMASHELKTPLTTLKGYTQALQHMFNAQGNSDVSSYLERMDKQIKKLNSLIGDLLDSSRVKEGELVFDEKLFDFNELAKEVIDEMQQTTQSHTININLQASDMIFGDRDRIGQVMTNMLSNAIKYSPKANTINVTTVHKKNSIIFCVQDFGIGILKENKLHIFDQFYRVSGLVEDTFPGTGLGMFIASEIIKRSHGTISVHSEIGKGSTFCFALPVKLNSPDKV